jgi:hypothetical protein
MITRLAEELQSVAETLRIRGFVGVALLGWLALARLAWLAQLEVLQERLEAKRKSLCGQRRRQQR